MSTHAYHFDLDGTLVELAVPFERIVSEAAASVGAPDLPASAFGRAFAAALHDDPDPIATAANAVADDIDASAFHEAFVDTEVGYTRARPDAATVLERLSAAHPIGVLTNGVGRLQREKLSATGLDAFVDDVVVSGDVGAGKPDPSIYRTAADGLEATSRTFVADDYERDLRSALELGWEGILLADESDAADSVRVISGLSELLP